MNLKSSVKKALFSCAITLLAATTPTAHGRIFDGGVDSENLGKGDWLWSVSISAAKLNNQVPGVTDIPSLMSWYRNNGIDFIIVKAATGSTNYPTAGAPSQFNSNLVFQAHQVGLKIFGYTRSYGDDIPGEIAVATACYNAGADGFVFDAEAEWESSRQGTQGPAKAVQMLSAVKAAFPTKLLAHAPLPYISLHSSFPYKEFGYYCDVVMPQDYWNYIGVTPAQMVADMNTEWRNWQNSLSGKWTNSIKPIAPIGQADIPAVPASEITAFYDAVLNTTNPATAGGYKGISWWDTHQHTTNHWPAIAAGSIGSARPVADVIVDNPAATVTGTWSVGTSSADKYGADYRFKSAGTGAASLLFRPTIPLTGSYRTYQWHEKGSNRTTNAPVTITHAAGSTTVRVNQQINGGSWVYTGTYNFNAGTAGTVKVADNYADTNQLIMADAVMFAYVTPPPTAPNGLTATTADGPIVTLDWTDNSSDEVNFMVYRSTTPGGPYAEVACVAANTTSYTDRTVATGTTYYYVVRSANIGGYSANSNEATITSSSVVSDIIIDNPSALVTGTWSTGTASADKFGTNYRSKGQGTGSANLQYTPEIYTPGSYQVYEWHPQGANRTVGAPHVIIHSTGSTTVNVNQQTLGGRWNLVGTYTFAAGTAGSVKITDGFADAGQSVMADAIKFQYAPPVVTPAAPSGLTATAVSQSQINLSWTDNSNNEDNFTVSRSITPGGPYIDIVVLGANTTSFNNTGLSANTTYYYVVRASNTGGTSANSTEANATTLPNAPTAPSGLSAAATSQTQINLSWLDNSSKEDNFIVARSATVGGPYTDIATLPANATSYSNSGLTANTTYYYVVRAANSGGESANSSEASATTLPVAPGIPSGLSASTVSQTQIDLSWNDTANETSFIVARSSVSGGPYSDIATLGADVTSYSDSSLSANSTYYYVVRAQNSGGTSANSAQASATTLPNPPAAPSSLAAGAVGQTQINLTWNDNSSNEDNFVVARSVTSGGPYSDIAIVAANTTAYSDTGVIANTAYYYVVRAVNTGGASANSAEAATTTLPNPPSAPSGLVASMVNASRIDLSWTDNANNEDNMIVARSTSAGGPYTDIATLAANATSYSDLGLSANTTYYYVVRAENTGGSSANSAQASATTLPNAPAAPSGLVATAVSSTRIDLTWTDNASNETGVTVARSTTSGGPYTDIATLAANTTSYSNSGLTANTTYYYVVRASNAGGTSANSAQSSITTFETDLLVDNKSAIVVGAWSTGSASTDKYSTDYRFKSAGTGAAYLQFTPNVATAGVYDVYEWHAQGANRANNAPHVITYNGGSQTIAVNQQINGGKWNLIGTFAFAAGNAGNIKITDNYTGTNVVMADAIKLVQAAPPTAPSGLTATAMSSTQINLLWTDNSTDETSFTIARSTVNGGPYTDIGSAAANTTSFSDTGLTASTTYYYVVRANSGAGSSANSAQALATTLQPPPAAPSGLTATTISQTQINLAWTDNSNNETSFIVGRSTTSGGPYTDIATLGANTTSYSSVGLVANTTYYFVVRAVNGTGASANSLQASATTLQTAPSPPGGLSASAASSSQINLTWTDNSPNEANFIVARSTTSGGPYTDIATLAANTTSYSNTGLSANTTYYYVVRAVNAGGASPNSNQASATTLQTVPTAPSALTASALSTSSIKLTWTDNSSNESNFVIARSTTSGGPYTDIVSLGANVTTYTNTGLAASTTYYFVVRGTNAAGSSANSAQASATTLTAAPAAPSALTASALTSTSIKLTWTDNASNESNFVVARSTVSGGPYTDIATLGANVTTYTNTGLNGSTTYYYVVRATNAGGSSANTAQASATTLAVADIIIDNPAATLVGTWTLASASTDKFGADYRYKSKGTGTNHVTFRPNIQVAGNYQVYEWHSMGSNRTTNAPVVISYNGGSATRTVNQKVNGGAWVAVGTPLNFAAGTNGFVRITDNIPDAGQIVISDAIKFVYVP